MKRYTVFFRGLFLLSASLSVPVSYAQDINLLPEGQTLVTLTVTERVQVQQDLLVASLRVEDEDRDAQALQSRINEKMEEGLALAADVPSVEVATEFYSVYQHDNSPQGGRTDTVWRGMQNISLESTDATALLALAGELQELGFVMNQLSYRLSNERADEVRDGLLETAIARATANAERAGRALGKQEIDIAVIDIDSALNYQPQMMRAARADTMEMAAPVAEAGESEVSLTVRVQAVAK